MGWLDTVLSAASAGASIYNASQLQTLRRQGAQAGLIQAMVTHLREQIFQFKQMAEYGLAQEAQSVKNAAGVISIVASRLHDSGITPELFPELGDKEYAMQTIRLISENKRRLLGLLSRDEQNEISHVVATAERLPDYNDYLENYNDGRRLAEAAAAVAQYASRNGCLAQMGLLAYAFVGIPAMVALFFSMFSGGDWGSSTAVGPGFILGAGAGLAGLIMFVRWMHAKEYKQAKKVVDELKDKIDLPRFVALDNEIGGSTRARQLQREAQGLIAAFFGDASSQPALIQSQGQRPSAPGATAEATITRGPSVTSSVGSGETGRHGFSEPGTPAPSPTKAPKINVSKRLGTVQSNVDVMRGPADSSGSAPWLVRKKGQGADAPGPLGEFLCPWCGQRYCVNAQAAHLELYCLGCGKGMWVDVE